MKKMIIAAMAALMLAGCASPKQEEEKTEKEVMEKVNREYEKIKGKKM